MFIQNGDWFIEAGAGGGSGVIAYASCVPGAISNRRFLHWGGNSVDNPATNKVRLDRNANTYCFLTGVSGESGWASATSHVTLERDTISVNGVWKDVWALGGNLVTQQDGSSGGTATAVCVDVSSQQVDGFQHQSAAGSAGLWATLLPTPGRTCGIHRLNGQFATDPYGLGDGARLLPEQNGSWKAFSSSAKKIVGECIAD